MVEAWCFHALNSNELFDRNYVSCVVLHNVMCNILVDSLGLLELCDVLLLEVEVVVGNHKIHVLSFGDSCLTIRLEYYFRGAL